MATKIKRCLYIGLGGTGMNALLHTKKMFIETYGEVPPMVAFLGVDTDGGVFQKQLPSKYGDVTISPNEQIHIRVDNAQAAFIANREHFSWVPEENVFALVSMIRGAGQIRTNGRFALTCNYDDLSKRVHSALSNIKSAHILDNPQWQVSSDNVEVHMVFSVGGGTGAGTFINMAYLVKDVIDKQDKLTGYAVLPDVFENMSQFGMDRVKPNAYGCIYDLDWFMHLNGTENIKFDYVKSEQVLQGAPFNAIFFIDNKNKNGDTYNNIDQLTEMISLALVTSAGELSDAMASVTDNLVVSIMNGEGSVGNKRAWVSGMGACEIVFRGNDMSDITALKNAQRVIQRLVSSCIDANNVANAWIDSPEVNIRENGGSENDNVIDYILNKQPKFPLETINDNQNARNEALGYVENVGAPKSDEVQKKVQELQNRVCAELHKLVVKCVNQECGVGLAKDVLAAIGAQVDIFLGEMESEKETLTQRKPALENAIDVAAADLSEAAGKFFVLKSTIAQYQQVLCDAAMALAVNRREICRRDAAITFFNSLKLVMNEEAIKVSNISKRLEAVNTEYVSELSEITNSVGRAADQLFQINLAKQAINTIDINDNEIQINDFLASLPYGDKLYDIDTRSTEEVEAAIKAYTKTLPTAREWEKTTIDDILNKMNAENPEKLDQVLRLALSKAQPLLSVDSSGEVNYKYSRFTYVGVPQNCTLLQQGNRLENLNGGNQIQFARFGMNDRVIIYNQIGVVLAKFIGGINNYKQKYEKCNVFSHIDYTIWQRMQREGFKLEPNKHVDDSVELWVKGLIFGLIKNDGHYYVKDKENGKSLHQFWVQMSQYRDEAFDEFKRSITSLRRQFEEYFETYERSNGTEVVQKLVDDAKLNYFDKYSQINMTIAQIESHGNEGIEKIISQELDYVDKKL